MKASRSEPTPFQPVTLTLETQAEVDGIYAFLRHVVSDRFGFEELACLSLEPFVKDPDLVFKEFNAAHEERWRLKL